MANNALTMRRECSNIFYMSNYLSSLGYPFRERPMVFVFSVLIVWAMYLALGAPVRGGIANFCFLGPFMCAFCMKMVRQSAMGDEGICHFPELEGWFESLFLPYVRTLVCAVIAFLPLSIYLNVVDWEPDALPGWFFMIAGIIYFPGIFMRTALMDSFDGLSPSGWWDLVRKAPMTYLGLVLGVLAGAVIVAYLPSGILMTFFSLAVMLYITCVLMNAFGLFLLKHEFAEEEDDDGFSISSMD